MQNFGKKLLSAFVDIEEETAPETQAPTTPFGAQPQQTYVAPEASLEKFKTYFDNLFKDANLPGPDYYEFSKMIEAMQSIPEEKTRFLSAFAGLSVQGLNKEKLLESAEQYIYILNADAENFNASINAALNEKVEFKKKQLEEKSQRIQELTREINDLNNEIMVIGNEMKENEEKINSNLHGYGAESEKLKAKIEANIQKIRNLL
ncbi:MAG: hypothetical protein M3040_17245 [Bacteroidota bacterium]|nr:hypothetical protein [Bacteroidota bacterium]